MGFAEVLREPVGRDQRVHPAPIEVPERVG